MGATSYSITGYGMSMREAFRKLHDEAVEEHGHEQGYSGAINCTDFTLDKTEEYNKSKKKEKYINELLEDVPKRETWGIELSKPKVNKNKVKTKVTINPQKGARKWETKYVVTPYFGDDGSVVSEKTQGLAIKKGREWVKANKRKAMITIEKNLLSGNSVVGDISFEQKGKEIPGKYLFLVCAPE